MPDAKNDLCVSVDERTLFLLGNGPSLKGVDFNLLSPYTTLGMNAAYRYWHSIGWRPTFYACLDTVVGLSHKDEIASLIEEVGEKAIQKFLLRQNLIEALGKVAQTSKVINFDALRTTQTLLQIDPITTGSHAALWAIEEGYQQVVMLGIDGRYQEIVDGARKTGGIELEIIEELENPNYFFDGYQQPGDRYNIPNPRPDLHLSAWREGASHLKNSTAKIFNTNTQSTVQCFDFIDLDDFITTSAKLLPATERVGPPTLSRGQSNPAAAPTLGTNARQIKIIGLLALISILICLITLGIFKTDFPTAIVASIAIGVLGIFALHLRKRLSIAVNKLLRSMHFADETSSELKRQLLIAKKFKKTGR